MPKAVTEMSSQNDTIKLFVYSGTWQIFIRRTSERESKRDRALFVALKKM